MLNEVPDDLRKEIQHIGRIRVGRYERWTLRLLTAKMEPQHVIDRLIGNGFSQELAEWMVYGVRETLEKLADVEEVIADIEEPPLIEVIARALFSATCLVFLGLGAEFLQRINRLSAYVLAGPLMMVAATAALIYFGLAMVELWERWRTRHLYQ